MTGAVQRLWQNATVVSSPDGGLNLEFEPAGCSRCDAGNGCGAGVFVRLFTRRRIRLPLPAGCPARPGEPVRVGMPAALLNRIALRLYALPLAAFVLGAVAGHGLAPAAGGAAFTDAAALVAGLVTGGATLAWQSVRTRRMPLDPEVTVSERPGGT